MTPAQKRDAKDLEYLQELQAAVDNLRSIIQKRSKDIDVRLTRRTNQEVMTISVHRIFPNSGKARRVGETK